jgi:LysR family glycine cleavage system transcriptional activator
VREFLDALADATRQLRTPEKTGGLTVSTTFSFTSGWLVPRLGRFRALHPDIDVRLQANDRLIDFARDNVDLAIRYGRGHYPGQTAERLMGEDYAPVSSPALLEGKHPLRKPSDLRDHVLLHEEATEVDWRMWLMAAGIEGIDASRGPIFSHSAMAIQAAIRAEGVALGRTALIEEELAAGRLVRLFDLRLKAEMAYYIVYPPRALERPKVRAFRDWLLAEARRGP